MESGLRIKFVWHDMDLIEVSVSASNGAFAGDTHIYINDDDLKNAASILEGFPRNPTDTRQLSLGTMDPQFAGGGVSLRFFCRDSSGHAAIELRIKDEDQPVTNKWRRPTQTAHFFADVEASAIDCFVRELRAFAPYEHESAFLPFAVR